MLKILSCVYYYHGDIIIIIRERLEVLSAMVDARALEFVILEVGDFHGGSVG